MSGQAKLKSFVLLPQAEKDLNYWQKSNPKKLERIRELIESVMIDPDSGIGKPELLKYLNEETYSRRIDREHRMVYSVRSDRLIIKQLRFHYLR